MKVVALSAQNPRDFEYSTSDTLTAADGTFRVPATKGGAATLSIVPTDYAPVQLSVGEIRGDVGKIVLKPGSALSGRLIDRDGKGLSGVPVSVWQREPSVTVFPTGSPLHRAALTDAEGRFTLAPMLAGRCSVSIDDRLNDPLVEDHKRYAIPAVFVCATLSCPPTRSRSKSRPCPTSCSRGSITTAGGRKSTATRSFCMANWAVSTGSEQHGPSTGASSLRIPQGLDETQVMLRANEHHALRHRTRPGDPLISGRAISLGKIDGDFTGLEIVVYDAPLLLVKAVDENGDAIKSFKVAGNAPESGRTRCF